MFVNDARFSDEDDNHNISSHYVITTQNFDCILYTCSRVLRVQQCLVYIMTKTHQKYTKTDIISGRSITLLFIVKGIRFPMYYYQKYHGVWAVIPYAYIYI